MPSKDVGTYRDWRAFAWVFSLFMILVIPEAAMLKSGSPLKLEPGTNTVDSALHDVPTVFEHHSGYFVENRGQVVEGVRYYSTGTPSIAFRDDGIMFVIRDVDKDGSGIAGRELFDRLINATESKTTSYAYILRFEGASMVLPMGRGKLPFKSNFFIGNDQVRWRTDVPSYMEVVYHDLYEGVDLRYFYSERGLKYEFIVQPKTEPDVIKMTYEGIDSLQYAGDGVAIRTDFGEVHDSNPYSFQSTGGMIDCQFTIKGRFSLGFDCSGWDDSETLIIDPLVFSTFIGGNRSDYTSSIAIDANRSVYITGRTRSTDFPITVGAFTTESCGLNDIFVSKLNSDGKSLVFSTFLGGLGNDNVQDMTVDALGNSYLTGNTNSSDFPTTPGAFDTTLDAPNAPAVFVTKLNSAGNALVYSTYLEGSVSELGAAIAVDSVGYTYVAGGTQSSDFPTTPGAFDNTYNDGGIPTGMDVFVAKLNPMGNSLIYSTFIGGGRSEQPTSITLDQTGNVLLTGLTNSMDYPTTPSAFDTSSNVRPCGTWYCSDAFVTKLNPMGTSLVYSTYLGGSETDSADSIVVTSAGDAYIAGSTDSTDFPVTLDALQGLLHGASDAFLTALNPSGSLLKYSTFLGGSNTESSSSIASDFQGRIYVAGQTSSTDFPVTVGSLDSSLDGGYDGFLTELNITTPSLVYSTYIGGSNYDIVTSIKIDDSGYAYISGVTNSTDFPVTNNSYDTKLNGDFDAFVMKLNPIVLSDPPDLTLEPSDIASSPISPVVVGANVTISARIHNYGGTNASGVVVRFYDRPSSNSSQIGADQIIPFIQYLGGEGISSIVWTADIHGVHDICVEADPDNLIIETSESNNIACKSIEVLFSLQLTPDHRLISFPLAVSDGSVSSVLSSISGCYDSVRWYDPLDSVDPWKSYRPGRAYNDLTHLDNTMGFWINITATCNFTPNGTRPTSTTIELHTGWNMVGFPSFNTTYTVADMKADISVAGILVETYDASAGPYYLQRVSDDYVIRAGEGYWVYVPSDATWTISG